MLLSRILRTFGLVHLVLGALVATVLVTEPSVRRYGDHLQIALPLLAWGCAATGGEGREFAIRFAAMLALAHGAKTVLGDSALNRRPNGHEGGFPSAHTAAASLGASSLAHDCLRGNPAGQAVVVIAAAFVGGSRIEVGAHTLWQVLAGALLGWACDRVLRAGRLRLWLIAGAKALGRRLAGIAARTAAPAASGHRWRHGPLARALSLAALRIWPAASAALILLCLVLIAAVPALALAVL